MKRTELVAMVFAAVLGAHVPVAAQSYVESHPEVVSHTIIRPDTTVLLYPGGQTAMGIVEKGVQVTHPAREDNGLRGEETCSPGGNRGNIGDDARMDIYIPKRCGGLMVIICPGGGYSFVSSFNEGSYAAKWLCDRGIAACVLKYRMPNHHMTVPLDDIHNALRYCRWHAAEWGVRRIGVMGASAGGHLAACASTMWDDETTRPDFAVLLYPRITLRRGESNGTKNNLIGKDVEWDGREDEQQKLLEQWSPDCHVTDKTPATFIALSSDDSTVAPSNPMPYYCALVKCHVPVEMHAFASGGHGWGFSAEKYVGEGRDRFATHRPAFEAALARWLDAQ